MLSREDGLKLLKLLKSEPELLAEFRRVVLPLGFEVWMVRLKEQLAFPSLLEQRLSALERDVKVLKDDMGMLKGKVLEINYRDKAASILVVLFGKPLPTLCFAARMAHWSQRLK